jgi:hypothetical protein
MTIQFWANDPTILFNKDYIFELWPTSSMCYEQKMNAISRLIILLTILGYILTMSTRILAVGVLTLLVIFILYNMRKQKLTRDMLENFEDKSSTPVQGNEVTGMFDNKPKSYINPVTLDAVLRTEFKEGTKKNPFSNVLLTQISDEPERKAAPPAFNPDCDEDITKNVKRAVQMMNPGIKNTNKQLFGDLFQKFQLDQANRVFYSCPNTKITNDQGAYGNFLFGNMISSKESDPSSALARIQDSYRYTLY